MGRANLQRHVLSIAGGLATNYPEHNTSGKRLLAAQNVDGYDTFQAVGKLPGATELGQPNAGFAVNSIHQFEFTDLDLIRKRHQLAFAGSVFKKFDSGTTWDAVPLANGILLEGLEMARERLQAATMLDRLHLSSKNQLALATGGVKYDGTRLSPWGVLAPGLKQTVIEALDNDADWTPGTSTTVETETSIHRDGAASVRMEKDGAAVATASMTSTGNAYNLTTAGQGELYVWLFIPSGGLQELYQTADDPTTTDYAVEITLGDAGLANADHYRFTLGELSPGWNLLSMVLASPDDDTGTGADLSNIADVRLLLQFSSTTARAGVYFYWDRMYVVDSGTVSVAVSGSGLTGSFRYRVTFVTEYGLESNAGPVSATATAADDQVDITNVPISEDLQVIARRIYRDSAADGLYKLVGTIYDNVTTTFTDNVAVASGSPPLAGDESIDNSHPERLLDFAAHENVIVGVLGEDRFTVVISEAGSPEAFPIVNRLTLEDEIVSVHAHFFGLLLYSQDRTYLFSGAGTDDSPYRIDLVNLQLGVNGTRAVCRVKGYHVLMHDHQVFLVQNPTDPWFLNGPVFNLFKSPFPGILGDTEMAAVYLASAHLVHDTSRQRVVIFGQDSDGDYTKILVYQYGCLGIQEITSTESGVDPQDPRTGTWWTMLVPEEHNPQCSEMVERDAEKPELWVGGEDGYVYHYQDPDQIGGWEVGGASAQNVASIIETVGVPLGSSIGGRGEPRFIEFNWDHLGANPIALDVTVSLYTGPDGGQPLGTTEITYTSGTGSNVSSPIIPIPSIGRGEWCRITIESDEVISVGSLREIILYYIPRVDMRGARTR